MTKVEHLLVCLIEECSEFQQAASKALRFGLHDKYKDYPMPIEQLVAECNDLLAVIELVTESCGLENIGNRELIEDKKAKVKNYLEYAEKQGTLNT